MAIGAALIQILLDDAAVAAHVGTRVYPARIPKDATNPVIRLNQISATRDYSLSDAVGFSHPRWQVDIYADTYAEARGLADDVRLALEAFSGEKESTTISFIWLDNEQDQFDEEIEQHRVILDFQIMHQE